MFAMARQGSPAYMAPEHLWGGPDFHSEIWSLGVILYEMLTGAVPTYGDDLVKFDAPPIVPPSLKNPAVPRAFSNAVMKALALNYGDRYLSAQDFYIALKEGMTPASRVRNRSACGEANSEVESVYFGVRVQPYSKLPSMCQRPGGLFSGG